MKVSTFVTLLPYSCVVLLTCARTDESDARRLAPVRSFECSAVSPQLLCKMMPCHPLRDISTAMSATPWKAHSAVRHQLVAQSLEFTTDAAVLSFVSPT